MKAALIALTALALVVAAPAAVQAQDPCPSDCAPPEPCGWGPDLRKDPDGWVLFYVDCVEDEILLP